MKALNIQTFAGVVDENNFHAQYTVQWMTKRECGTRGPIMRGHKQLHVDS